MALEKTQSKLLMHLTSDRGCSFTPIARLIGSFKYTWESGIGSVLGGAPRKKKHTHTHAIRTRDDNFLNPQDNCRARDATCK
jgi:hypothetical protein